MDNEKLRRLFEDKNSQLKDAYSGLEPYIFISYAHEDLELVKPYLVVLQEEANVWYDVGIKPGENWIESIVKKVDDCEVFFLFISNNSIKSKWVHREIQRAIDKDKQIISVYLENTNLPDALQFQIGIYQMIQDKNVEKFIESIPQSVRKTKEDKAIIIYNWGEYKYVFEEGYHDFTISKISTVKDTKEILFHSKESTAFLCSFNLHSVRYLPGYIFDKSEASVLSFRIYIDRDPDVAQAPYMYSDIEFNIKYPNSENSELKILKLYHTAGKRGDDCENLRNKIVEIDDPIWEDNNYLPYHYISSKPLRQQEEV